MAEAAFRPPQFTSDESNASRAWKDFKEEMTIYFTAAGFTDEDTCPGKRKVAILLYAMGQRYRRVYDNFTWETEEQKHKYAEVEKQFDKYFEPKKVTKLYMKRFDDRVQSATETISEYVTSLRWQV